VIWHRHENDRTSHRSLLRKRFACEQVSSKTADEKPETDRCRERRGPAFRQKTEKNDDVVCERWVKPDTDIAESEICVARPRRIKVTTLNSIVERVYKSVVLGQIVAGGHPEKIDWQRQADRR
jgi:hypothetical protein